jgi:DNA-binding NtrC family response regulator
MNQFAQSSNNRRLSIVCVEDDDVALDLVVQIIRSVFPTADIREFRYGDAAPAYCLADPPDVLVTNVNMPRLTGIELVKELRRRGLTMPTLITSGTCSMERFKREGIQFDRRLRFVQKPFTMEQIISEIKALMEPGGGGR